MMRGNESFLVETAVNRGTQCKNSKMCPVGGLDSRLGVKRRKEMC
jgi:hypothetical protein